MFFEKNNFALPIKVSTFTPKLFSVLKGGYSLKHFSSDLTAGIIVGIVALPLAIAFAIASGVPPEKGLYTAIVAGFVISFLGGSKVQIGGPTGAFIVIVYGIVQQYGVNGLTIATFMAGIIIIIMGLARLGAVIKFIPYPLIVGFTSGIAVVIFSSQIKDIFGLEMGTVPSDFIEKWKEYFLHFNSINFYAFAIAIGTAVITFFSGKLISKIPGSLIAVLLATIVVQVLNLPVETIESRFGDIPSILPKPNVPSIDFSTIQHLIQPAFTIALLGAIESLLSAVVSDGMIGGNHRSNMELVAQGTANIFSSIFGGIPATGAIARTVTNIKNGGRTPIAGIIHAVTLLIIMLFVGKWAKLIPLSCLAGILIVVSYNMSEWRSFLSVTHGSKSDTLVLVTTFLLTVFIDLTVAIEVGMVLAAFLFMRRMAVISNVSSVSSAVQDEEGEEGMEQPDTLDIPKGVEIYEVNGPLFFGASHKIRETIKITSKNPRILIIRMRHVPVVDATGIHNLKEIIKQMMGSKTKIILSGVQPSVYIELEKTGLVELIGNSNVMPNIKEALERAKEIITTPNSAK